MAAILHTFETYEEGNYKYRKNVVSSWSFFQIIHDCTFYIELKLIKIVLVLWSSMIKSKIRHLGV